MEETSRARNTDPLTSHLAAASVTNTQLLRAHIVRLFDKWGQMTDERLVSLWETIPNFPQASPSGIRSRRSELTRAGYLVSKGLGKSSAGRSAHVWGVVNND